MVVHPIEPVYNEESEILILGSFPSVKSREQGFFYGHPQNRFWRVLAQCFEDTVPESIDDKKAFLIRHHIAVWDVIHSCDITGSSDSSIKNVVPNNLQDILSTANIRQIYVNGKKALQLYNRYTEPIIKRNAICLPSTSPANAAWNMERLVNEWMQIKKG